MTCTLIGVLPGSGSGSITKDSESVSRKYLVVSDNWADEEPVVTRTPGLPVGYAAYGVSYPLLRVKQLSAERHTENSLWWIVTVEYGTPDGNTQGTDEPDPLDIRPEIHVDHVEMEVPIWGVYGNERIPSTAVKNSAGWVFNPPFMKKIFLPTYDIKINLASLAMVTTHLAYQGCVNSDSFLGWSARHVMCVNVIPKTETQNEFEYLSVTYSFITNPYSFDLIPLDYGPYHNQGGKKLEFKTDDGFPDGNGLLDGSGVKTTTPTYLPAKQIYTSVAFSGLGIPTDLSIYKYV